MNTKTSAISRRTVLRGMLGGAAVSVGLPLLDIFLNDNGTAMAGGAPIPVRFGTWFWGCGMNPDRWAPPTDGADYELSVELQALGDLKHQVSVFSGFGTILDGSPNDPHNTGRWINLTGAAAGGSSLRAPTFDTLISAQIGRSSRFRSLELSATGAGDSNSRESESIINASGFSPMEVYARIFGDDFIDPSAGPVVPNPKSLVRQSVLSVVGEQAAHLERELGSHDRQRLDQYFTSLRQLEKQIEISLRPPDLEACRRADAPRGEDVGSDLDQSMSTHRMLTELLIFALLCDQTRVFNMMFSSAASRLRKAGATLSHHGFTHDEPVDSDLGYQPETTSFVLASMDAWAEFVGRLATTPEGDGTLLDNCLVFANSESAFAKSHSIQGLPVMLAGGAGGRVTPGLHIRGNGEPITRIGLTVQQIMGVPLGEWGSDSMNTSNTVSEILA